MPFPNLKKHLLLAVLFLATLPVFGWLQWQPQGWLDRQLAEQGVGGSVLYSSVSKSFPGLQLAGVRFDAAGLNGITFETLKLRPAFSTLLSDTPGLYTRIEGEGIHAGSVITAQGNELDFDDIDLTADAGSLSRFDSRLLLLGLSGSLALRGHILLQADNGLPLDGHVELGWSNPASTLLPAGMQQLHIRLNSAEAEGARIWNWKIESQPEGMAGEGKIMAGGSDIRQWLLRGKLRSAKDVPEMVLSGTLGAPHWQ